MICDEQEALFACAQSSPTPPTVVTIFFGANDAALLGRTSERQYVPIEEYKENLRKFVNHLKVSSLVGDINSSIDCKTALYLCFSFMFDNNSYFDQGYRSW